MSTRYDRIDLDNLFTKRAMGTSLILHILVLCINITYSPPLIEMRDDAVKVTIATPEEVKKNKVLKTQSPFKESEVVKTPPKQKVIAGTQKVIPKAQTLGNPKEKLVQKVQKGDPLSKDYSAYKKGTDFRKLKATNIGSGVGPKLETAQKVGGGSGDTYKGLDFSTKSLSNMAKLGERFKVRNVADDMGAGAGRGGGIGDGVGKGFGDGTITGTGTGTLEKAKILTNVGSLTGADTGIIGSSKGSEGLSQKGAIVLSGMPEETVILGSMDPNLIRQILLGHLAQFRYCYQNELETSAKPKDLSGVVHLNFSINSQGNVHNMKIGGDQNITREVKNCVGGVLKDIQFPPPKGGGIVEVKQPMNFYPKQY